MDDSSELLTIITSSEIAGVDKLQKGGVNINSPKRPWSPSIDSRYSFPPLSIRWHWKDKRNKHPITESFKINRFNSQNDSIRFGYGSTTSALKFDILLYLCISEPIALHAVIRLPSKRTEDGIGRIEEGIVVSLKCSFNAFVFSITDDSLSLEDHIFHTNNVVMGLCPLNDRV